MKTLLKFVISFAIGCALIVVGLTLGGFEIAKDLWTNLNLEPFVLDLDIFSTQKQNDLEMICSSSIDHLEIELNNAVIEVKEHSDENIKIEARNIYKGFEVYQSNNYTLKIYQKQMIHFGNKKTADIVIYVPVGYVFDDVKLTDGIGSVKVNGLSCKTLSVDGGVGALDMKDVVADDMSVNLGLSGSTISNLECNHLDIDVGFGALSVDMVGNIDDYDQRVDVGMGSVHLNHHKYAGFSSNHHSNHHENSYNKSIEVDCGFGAVEIRGGI